MADALMKYETIDAGQIDLIMDGKDPGPPHDWGDDDIGPTAPKAPDESSADEDPNLDPAKLH
jgi:cell division protease FtsH